MKRRRETGEALATVQAGKAAVRRPTRPAPPVRNRRIHKQSGTIPAVERRAGFRR
jgi:hypothetical protein